jgi:hypothetical protein
MKKSLISLGLFFLILGKAPFSYAGRTGHLNYEKVTADSLLSQEIKKQINSESLAAQLYYPESARRFYAQNGYQAAWIKPQSGEGPAWQAMLMIDCVLQFGLSHNDYHPDELKYDLLHAILDTSEKIDINIQARFDIMLSDAIITLMNHLHYGKLNPEFSSTQIDKGEAGGFCAEAELALDINKTENYNLLREIESVQPRSKEYRDLQYQMHLLEGLYQGDCYQIPEEDVRKIAINMERLRWVDSQDSIYIQINIPSYTLTLYLKDTTYSFKVITGKPSTPTPTLQSAVSYLTTAPEWKVPSKIFVREILPKAIADPSYLENNHFVIYDLKGGYVPPVKANLMKVRINPSLYYARQSAGCDNALGLVVFRFPNPYDVYLHDTPEQLLFQKKDRDFSHGCIRVEYAGKLAELLLKNDGSAAKIAALHKGMSEYVKQNIFFRKPIPIKITYLTCEVNKGWYITYKDIYSLDKRLEMALYGADQQPLSMR